MTSIMSMAHFDLPSSYPKLSIKIEPPPEDDEESTNLNYCGTPPPNFNMLMALAPSNNKSSSRKQKIQQSKQQKQRMSEALIDARMPTDLIRPAASRYKRLMERRKTIACTILVEVDEETERRESEECSPTTSVDDMCISPHARPGLALLNEVAHKNSGKYSPKHQPSTLALARAALIKSRQTRSYDGLSASSNSLNVLAPIPEATSPNYPVSQLKKLSLQQFPIVEDKDKETEEVNQTI